MLLIKESVEQIENNFYMQSEVRLFYLFHYHFFKNLKEYSVKNKF